MIIGLKKAVIMTSVTLAEAPVGTSGRVCSLRGCDEFCQRLREMGFWESAIVAKLSGRCTFICQVGGSRIALSEDAAKHIEVELINGD